MELPWMEHMYQWWLAPLLDPGERLYVVYLVPSLLILLYLRGGLLGARPLSKDKRGSLRVDLAYFIFRGPFRLLVLAPLLVSSSAVAIALFGWMQGLGLPRLGLEIGWGLRGCYTVLLFLAWDLSRFLLHWAMHRFPWLWRFHQVHHSAEALTPLTLYRVHPVEILLGDTRDVLVTGSLAGAFSYLVGAGLFQVELAGVNALAFAFNLAAANLRHSHAPIAWPDAIERWVLSPRQHQIHHLRSEGHPNLGTCIAWWDRLLGTWTSSRVIPSDREEFGLARDHRNHCPRRFWSSLLRPLGAPLKPS